MAERRIEDMLKEELDAATECSWVREYQPCKTRRWRLDLALPAIKLAVEVDGQRHFSHKQKRSDCERDNYLVANGWRVLHYPASSVLTKSRLPLIVEQIKAVTYAAGWPEDWILSAA